MTGIERITAERQRQLDVEGWTSAHDDQHMHGELAAVAAYYAELAFAQSYGSSCLVAMKMQLPSGWPCDVCWWKPSDDPMRNLEKAGALIIAEMARLARVKGEV